METFFVSARRMRPCLVSWQKRKVMSVLVIMVMENKKYNTRTTGTTEYLLTNRPEIGAKNTGNQAADGAPGVDADQILLMGVLNEQTVPSRLVDLLKAVEHGRN